MRRRSKELPADETVEVMLRQHRRGGNCEAVVSCSIYRTPCHRLSRLAYPLEQAHEHAAMMKDYSESELRAILRHSPGVIERARLGKVDHR